jgi:hypothetical protein
VTRHRGTWRGHAERRCADTPSTRAQAPPGDRMFYKGQTLTFQKGYANAAEDELLPVVGEVASTSQPARAPAGCCAAHADGAAPRAPQWLEHDCQARCRSLRVACISGKLSGRAEPAALSGVVLRCAHALKGTRYPHA